MFKDYAIVKAVKPLSETVPSGSIGTILTTYEKKQTQDYEVEFVDNEGNTLDLLTVSESDIEPVASI